MTTEEKIEKLEKEIKKLKIKKDNLYTFKCNAFDNAQSYEYWVRIEESIDEEGEDLDERIEALRNQRLALLEVLK